MEETIKGLTRTDERVRRQGSVCASQASQEMNWNNVGVARQEADLNQALDEMRYARR